MYFNYTFKANIVNNKHLCNRIVHVDDVQIGILYLFINSVCFACDSSFTQQAMRWCAESTNKNCLRGVRPTKGCAVRHAVCAIVAFFIFRNIFLIDTSAGELCENFSANTTIQVQVQNPPSSIAVRLLFEIGGVLNLYTTRKLNLNNFVFAMLCSTQKNYERKREIGLLVKIFILLRSINTQIKCFSAVVRMHHQRQNKKNSRCAILCSYFMLPSTHPSLFISFLHVIK